VVQSRHTSQNQHQRQNHPATPNIPTNPYGRRADTYVRPYGSTANVIVGAGLAPALLSKTPHPAAFAFDFDFVWRLCATRYEAVGFVLKRFKRFLGFGFVLKRFKRFLGFGFGFVLKRFKRFLGFGFVFGFV
jgi:hypothetical protein